MKAFIHIGFIVILIAVVVGSTAFSQDLLESRPTTNIELGFGFYLPIMPIVPTATAQISHRIDDLVLSTHVLVAKEIGRSIGFGGDPPPLPKDEFVVLAATIGKEYRFHLSFKLFPCFPLPLLKKGGADYSVTGSIGICYLHTILRDDIIGYETGEGTYPVYSTKDQKGLGVPIQIDFVQKLSPSVGYVHRLYANVNSQRSFYTFTWAVQVFF